MNSKRVDFALQWVATTLTLAGAVLTAIGYNPANMWCFNIGTVVWLVWSIRARNASLIAVNAGLLLVYTVGILRSFFI